MSLSSRRPRFQLSLRSWFLLFLLACVLLGLGIKWRQRALLQQSVKRELKIEVVHEVLSVPMNEVEFRYDYQLVDDPVQQRLFSPKPSWLCSVFGVDMIHRVKEVEFQRQASGSDFELLSRLGYVSHVDLRDGVQVAADWNKLFTLDSLKQLSIAWGRTPISESVLHLTRNRFEAMSRLTKLNELKLRNPQLTIAEWKSIFQHTKLETLAITELVRTTPQLGPEATSSTSIRNLYLSENRSSEETIRELLSKTGNLRFLSIGQHISSYLSFSDEIFESISKLEKLEQLFLHGTGIRGHELHRLHQLPIREMGLGLSNLDDQGLENIVGFKQLNYLEVGSTKISDSGMKSLAQLSGLQYLSIRDTQVSDEGFLELAKIKGLKTIRIRDTLITDDGVQQFRRLLPECAIDVR
jgi:hypothetical protein